MNTSSKILILALVLTVSVLPSILSSSAVAEARAIPGPPESAGPPAPLPKAELVGPVLPAGWVEPAPSRSSELVGPPRPPAKAVAAELVGPPRPAALVTGEGPRATNTAGQTQASQLSNGGGHIPVQAQVQAAKSPPSEVPAQTPIRSSDKADGPTELLARHPLSEVINDKLSGLAFEPAAVREKLLEEAREFVDVRDSKASFPVRARAVSQCLNDGEPKSPYCDLILRITHGHGHHRLARMRRAMNARARRLQRKIEAGDLAALSDVSDDLVLSAIRRIPDTQPLTALTDAALKAKACPSTALLTALGSHVEQRMPDEQSKELAASLYRRSTECGNDLYSIQASYRLGLIRIWQQRYGDAQEALARIPNTPDAVDYRSRALYWRFYCAKQMNEPAVMNEMRTQLLREYPLSLHALLVGAGMRFGDVPSGQPGNRDSETAFRSATRPELNSVLRATEALLSLDENMSAAELLGSHLDFFKGAESAVQLYGAVLMMRSGDTIRKFQLLALMIRENPDSLTRPSLEMLYPIRRFDMVKSYEAMVDPWVVLSLIRQESAFNDRARSSVGAIGLMQLMPKTARRVARVSKRQLFDPAVNIRVGVKYFSRLLDRFGGDVELALASYNAGPDKVDEWKKRYPTSNRLLFMDLMPYRETREYVASIARNYFWYLKLYGQDAFEKSFGQSRTPASGKGFFVFSQFNPLLGPDLQSPAAHPGPTGSNPATSPIIDSPNGSMRQTVAPGIGERIALASGLH